jgi:chorismate--pyruvate lyase
VFVSDRIAKMRYVRPADRWQPITPDVLHQTPVSVRDWLGWPDSLTEQLSNHLGDRVQVRVLSERVDRLLADEREHLTTVSRMARIREVRLEVRGTAYVVARTVFPDSTARVMDNALKQLGTRSLGSLLFGMPRAPVCARELTCMRSNSALWRVLSRHLPSDSSALWARRALHRLQGQPLLVTEIFLPQLFTKTYPARAQSSTATPIVDF